MHRDRRYRSRVSDGSTRLRLGLLLAISSLAAAGAVAQEVERDFAESFALVGVEPDASQEISIRIARFPGRGRATLWMSAFVGGRRFAVVDESLDLGELTGRAPVDSNVVAFAVQGSSRARLESRDRSSETMLGSIHASADAHESLHPPNGPGSLPLEIEARFVAASDAVRVRRGRRELFGRVVAKVTSPAGVFEIDVPGKWHEQTGVRPRFAPAFIYFAVQGDEIALLARGGPGATWGYLKEGDRLTSVESFEIDPLRSACPTVRHRPRRRPHARRAGGGRSPGFGADRGPTPTWGHGAGDVRPRRHGRPPQRLESPGVSRRPQGSTKPAAAKSPATSLFTWRTYTRWKRYR